MFLAAGVCLNAKVKGSLLRRRGGQKNFLEKKGIREGLRCLGDVTQQHGRESLVREPQRAIASWGLITTGLYLISGQQMGGEVSQSIQIRQVLNG